MIKLGKSAGRISTHCGQNNSCVQVASTRPDSVQIADTKDAGRPEVRVTPAAFAAFLEGVKAHG